MEIKFAVDAKDMLGESPVWCAKRRALYWLDNLAPSVKRYIPSTGAVEVWEMPEFIGSIGLREGGGLVAGMGSGFAFIDLEIGSVDHAVDPEPELPNTRLNDGKVDRKGRFWCGSMNANFAEDYQAIAAERFPGHASAPAAGAGPCPCPSQRAPLAVCPLAAAPPAPPAPCRAGPAPPPCGGASPGSPVPSPRGSAWRMDQTHSSRVLYP